MHKKMLLISFAISLSSCATLPPSAPKPPVVKSCDLIATAPEGQYLRCMMSAGKSEIIRIPVETLYKRPEKYICTDDKGYADTYAWTKKMETWIANNCEGK